MSKISRFVIWIYSKFTRREIEQIIAGLLDVLEERNPEVKPRDDFKVKHPNYMDFSVDPLAPLTEPPEPKILLFLKDHSRSSQPMRLSMASLYLL